MKNQIFIPTVAEFPNDISTSWTIQESLVNGGYLRGLMLVIRGGRKGVTLDSTVQKQHLNIEGIQNYEGAIVTMLSNIPIEEIDLLHNPEYSAEHVKRGIDFSKKIKIGDRKILTFHLNSLTTPAEYAERGRVSWRNRFHTAVRPALQEVAKYGKEKGVEVKVETVPVPEFGDIPDSDERAYRGAKLNELRNPFYLTSDWGFEQVQDTGVGICLDICHNRTIYEIAKLGDPDCILHEEDRVPLAARQLYDDIAALEKTDMAHANDGSSIYSKARQTVHLEGVALGEGDIKDLRKIIDLINHKEIPFVLEVNEIDFKNRPNTKRSIEYLLEDKK